MIKELKVETSCEHIDHYESMLSKFSNWKQYRRDIILSDLLNTGKKIEFIVDIKYHIFGVIYIDFKNDDSFDISLGKACASIQQLKFILKDNHVESLDITIKVLDTEMSKELKDVIESGTEVMVKQIKSDNKFIKFSIY
jgi:hypothetical protein